MASCARCNRLNCPEGKKRGDFSYEIGLINRFHKVMKALRESDGMVYTVGGKAVGDDYLQSVIDALGIERFYELNPWYLEEKVAEYTQMAKDQVYAKHPELNPANWRRVAYDSEPEPVLFQVCRERITETDERFTGLDRRGFYKKLRKVKAIWDKAEEEEWTSAHG